MKNKKLNITSIITLAKKMAEDKKAILDYSKGKITKEALDKRGIKFTMPI